MKKLLIILLMVIGVAKAQWIDTLSGGVRFTLPNGTAYTYSENANIFVSIDNRNKARFYTKTGAQVQAVYAYYEWFVDSVRHTNQPDFLYSVLQIPTFMQISDTAINGINDMQYNNDTLTLLGRLDTLSAYIPSGDGLWTTDNGYYENVEDVPFIQSFQNLNIINDSIDLGVTKIPFVGVKSEDVGNYKMLNGYFDASSVGLGGINGLGAFDLMDNKYNAIYTLDTSRVVINSNDDLDLIAKSKIVLNSDSGVLIQPTDIVPNGEDGKIYFNETDSVFRGYQQGNWHDLIQQSGWGQYTDTTYTLAAPFSILADDTITLPNNAQTINETYINGLPSLYNSADSLITPSVLGGLYDYRVSFWLKPTNSNSSFSIMLDIGGGFELIAVKTSRAARGTQAHKYTVDLTSFAGAYYVANGGKIKIVTEHNATIWGISYLISKD